MEKTIAQLDLFKKYESIIDLDIALFGLIYFIVFMEKEIDCCNKNELLKKISEKIDELRGIPRHLKTPSTLKYLRKRVEDSISIYEEFVK